MTGFVDLVCWTCGATWSVARRRGQYPQVCGPCRYEKQRQEALERHRARRARTERRQQHKENPWVRRHGTPPTSDKQRAEWIARCLTDVGIQGVVVQHQDRWVCEITVDRHTHSVVRLHDETDLQYLGHELGLLDRVAA